MRRGEKAQGKKSCGAISVLFFPLLFFPRARGSETESKASWRRVFFLIPGVQRSREDLEPPLNGWRRKGAPPSRHSRSSRKRRQGLKNDLEPPPPPRMLEGSPRRVEHPRSVSWIPTWSQRLGTRFDVTPVESECSSEGEGRGAGEIGGASIASERGNGGRRASRSPSSFVFGALAPQLAVEAKSAFQSDVPSTMVQREGGEERFCCCCCCLEEEEGGRIRGDRTRRSLKALLCGERRTLPHASPARIFLPLYAEV